MRRFSLLVALLSGCLHQHAYVAGDGAVLGRVVVYRNGVAFYERRATVVDGKLSVHVPRDRVDDFLKSLTVVDRATGKALPVEIPRDEHDGNNLTMEIDTPDRSRADVLLTYVTEAPTWKPSYRVVVGGHGKVMLQGWAIVDNLTGEDWNGVLVGVGASSALAFRYDLWSVHRVERDLLQGDEQFAVAPPPGVSPYEQSGPPEELANLGNVNPTASAAPSSTTGVIQGVVTDKATGQKLAGVTISVSSPALRQSELALTDENGVYKIGSLPPGVYQVGFFYGEIHIEQTGVAVRVDKTTSAFQAIDQTAKGGETIVISARVPSIDPTSTTQGVTKDTTSIKHIPVPGRTFESALGAAAGSQNDGIGASFSGSTSLENNYIVDGVNTTSLNHGDAGPPPTAPHVPTAEERQAAQLAEIANKVSRSRKDVLIEAHGTNADEVKARANAMRDRLVDDGVPAARIRISPQVGPGETVGARVLGIAPGAAPPTAPPVALGRAEGPDTPVGESHFISERPMTVRTGSSALVSMVQKETTGGIVYFYDPISDRGDARYAFKAVRLDNPTGDTLEPGPMTVYGDGRFIGEGIAEAVPPHASVVVPFALDREIVVARSEHDDDRIAKLVTVERGVASAEVQHRRITRFAVTNRSTLPAKVFLRHRLQSDWKLVDAPPRSLELGDSKLFEVDLAPHATQDVEIAEATPVERTLELSSDDALEMMKVYIEDPAATPELRAQIESLLATHRASADAVDQIRTLRDQIAEYREREGELHGQLITLKAVHTGGSLLTALKAKLVDTSDRIQKATIAIVEAQEQLMLLRVKFGNQLAELHVTDITKLSKR
ncbi:MAG TPA: carboxypeptidase regulatory-like domain-containing protein [Kofleriaceae bacterium]|jgi:hypothetical protein